LPENTPGAIITVVAFRLRSGDRTQDKRRIRSGKYCANNTPDCMNFLHSVSWLITHSHPASCFCGSFLYVFITHLFLVFFFIYLCVFIHFFLSLLSVFRHSSLFPFLYLSISLSLCLYFSLPLLSLLSPVIQIQHRKMIWYNEYALLSSLPIPLSF
jgi:hypothetical protein